MSFTSGDLYLKCIDASPRSIQSAIHTGLLYIELWSGFIFLLEPREMLGERREREREENVLYVAGWTDSVVSTGCAEQSATRQVGCSLAFLSSITVRPVARELSPCSVRIVGWKVHWKWITVFNKMWES